MSHSLGLVWDSSFLHHDAGAGHPERPERLIAIRERMLEKSLWARMEPLELREAEEHELLRNHTKEHVARVLAADGQARTIFDGDTIASAGTTKAALRAAAGAIDLAKAVWRGEVERGFSLGRPPGHHAERDTAMGFCYFNNIALAARALLEEEGLERILIVDWDVHHGNGTQHAFEEEPRVLFFSIHQYPFYPGTGSAEEIGLGRGMGYNVNVPLRAFCGDHEYVYFFERLLRPIAQQFRPQIILLSAGYDAHQLDPLGSMRVTTGGFAHLASELISLADELCEGKCAAMLEGGYDLEGLSESVVATMKVMLGDDVELSGNADEARESAAMLRADLRGMLGGIWSLEP